MRHLTCDIAVIGSGLAGLRAALASCGPSLSVMLCSKSRPGIGSCTAISQGHFRSSMAGFGPEDHRELTLQAGQGLNLVQALNILTEQAEPAVRELETFGVHLQPRTKGFDTLPVKVGQEGAAITKPLVRSAESRGISLVWPFLAWRVVTVHGRASGVLGFLGPEAEPAFVQASAVVLATGGAGALYARTDNPQGMLGSGYALAYHAGLPLMDMEFVQFYPLCLAGRSRTSRLLPPLLAEVGTLTNADHEDIAGKHAIHRRPLAIAARDELCQAMIQEVFEGRGCNGAVALNISADDAVWRNAARSLGIQDLSQLRTWVAKKLEGRDFLPVLPAAHFCMGGVIVDERCRTGLPGLLAAGEVVGGLHGANRYGGNALSEAAVFGRIAGEQAARAASAIRERDLPARPALDWCREQLKALERARAPQQAFGSQHLKQQIQDLMWQHAGVIRSGQSLQHGLKSLLDLKPGAAAGSAGGKSLVARLEVMNAILVAETILRSALFRRESRGAHFRSDFPAASRDWTGHVLISKTGLEFRKRAIQCSDRTEFLS